MRRTFSWLTKPKGKVDTHARSIDSTRKKRRTTKKKLTKVILSSLYTIHITQPYSTPLEFHPRFGGQITWKWCEFTFSVVKGLRNWELTNFSSKILHEEQEAHQRVLKIV